MMFEQCFYFHLTNQLINYCIDVFRVKMLSKQDQTGPFLSRKDNLLDLELLLGCRKWKEKLTVLLINSKNLLEFISAIMPLSMDLNLKGPRRPQRFSLRFFWKNRCKNLCPYTKLLKKSLQLWKKVVMCMDNNYFFCSFNCSVRGP